MFFGFFCIADSITIITGRFSKAVLKTTQQKGRFMWQIYAFLSAVFAALVAILAKIGIAGVNSNLAVAVRTAVILLIAWGIVLFRGGFGGLSTMTGRNWTFLILSGVATGLSWICYFKALSLGPASKVAPIDKLSVALTILLAFIVLGEAPEPKVIAGGLLIVAGSLLMIL